MFQNVLVNYELTVDIVEQAYLKKLINIGDTILSKHRFGVGGKVDRFLFIKIKSLLPYLRNDPNDTRSLNAYLSALNNK